MCIQYICVCVCICLCMCVYACLAITDILNTSYFCVFNKSDSVPFHPVSASNMNSKCLHAERLISLQKQFLGVFYNLLPREREAIESKSTCEHALCPESWSRDWTSTSDYASHARGAAAVLAWPHCPVPERDAVLVVSIRCECGYCLPVTFPLSLLEVLISGALGWQSN